MPPDTGAIISSDLEPVAERLIVNATEGGLGFLTGANVLDELGTDRARLSAFLAACHRGFAAAQEEVFERLLAIEKTDSGGRTPEQRGEAYLLRNIADVMAWQIIGRELYIARRLIRDGDQPSLVHSNAMSVLEYARSLAGQSFESFGLLADLTSFVQVGDLLRSGGPDARFTLIEVKEGAVNERVLNIGESLGDMPSPVALEAVRKAEGDKVADQLERVLRQKRRMAGTAKLLTDERGIDPHSKKHVVIQEVPGPLHLYDAQLDRVIAASHERGWSIDVIDDVLFLAAYRGAMAVGGHIMFKGWFEGMGAGQDSPVFELRDSLVQPLALPPFGRHLARQSALDVVFGRCRVFIGVHVPNYVALMRKHGASIRPATRKEIGLFATQGARPMTLEGKPLIIEHARVVAMLYDGTPFRMAFHGLTPESAAIASVAAPVGPDGDSMTSGSNVQPDAK